MMVMRMTTEANRDKVGYNREITRIENVSGMLTGMICDE